MEFPARQADWLRRSYRRAVTGGYSDPAFRNRIAARRNAIHTG